MKGYITITANDNGKKVHAYMELDSETNYSEERTVKDIIEHLLSYEPKTKTEDKEGKE